MGELTQTELYSSSNSPLTQQLWNAVLNLLGFVFQIFSQIIAPFSNYPLLSFSSSHSFDPLPTRDSPEPPSSAVEITSYAVDHCPLQKLTVVLDLDETLICAYETSSLPASLCAQATKAGLNWFEMECVSSDKEVDGKSKTNLVTVFERPGLKEFLRQVSEFADMVLFTAGLEGYASPLVDRIDTENRISRRLYRPSTISTEYREHVKDLTCISEDLCRIVIVDNNPFSFLLQPDNGIPCISFKAGQPHDTQLLDVILPLLKHLSNQRSVRHVLHDQFHMHEWFQQQGIPVST
ncbi:hypothetical protein Lal_00010990 [Lupinus albus]|uniref:Uncharacterized protein n=1 Tax=Lupinus albus TaxID=3870 RepID=A0A6A4PTC7_LUPAL|nr:putative protein-serine/threonine phosphatase [Lupinus albus]KAF1892524.1 hypothetical protein Lal_00010990 [Lupinus albus]